MYISNAGLDTWVQTWYSSHPAGGLAKYIVCEGTKAVTNSSKEKGRRLHTISQGLPILLWLLMPLKPHMSQHHHPDILCHDVQREGKKATCKARAACTPLSAMLLKLPMISITIQTYCVMNATEGGEEGCPQGQGCPYSSKHNAAEASHASTWTIQTALSCCPELAITKLTVHVHTCS